MLTNIADGLILPAYDSLNNSNAKLLDAVGEFTTQPSVLLLNECREAWKRCVLNWQRVGPYNFGPAEGVYGTLSENVATFPCDTSLLEQYISAGDTTFQNFDRDTRGYFSIDYLLFARDGQIVTQQFTDDPKRRSYLRAVVKNIDDLVSSVQQTWQTSYHNEFISRNGTDAGSSTSLLFNNMNMNYELAKNYEVALPLGKRAGQTQVEPTKVEAYYSGISIVLLREHFATIMRIWRGEKTDGSNIIGFKEYLESVPNGDRLITDMELQEDSVSMAMNALADNESLSEIISNQPERLEPLYTQMQKFTRFIKSELSSLIGIAITYSSGDGD